MVQIKLSIAFVLAAAAIAPVVAVPLLPHPHYEGGHEGGGAGEVDHHERHEHERQRHEHEHEHERHEHGRFPRMGHGGLPRRHQELPTSDAVPTPSRREYFDEFDIRGLFGDGSLLTNEMNALKKQDSNLENTHKTLTTENNGLERSDRHLLHEKHHLQREDHHLGEEDRRLRHTKHSLEKQDDSLRSEKHNLKHVDGRLGHERKTLSGQDKSLDSKHRSLLHKNSALTAKDKLLGVRITDREKLAKIKSKSKIPPKDRLPLSSKGNVLPKEGDVHAHAAPVHSTAKLTTREFDDMFERDLDNAESGHKPMRHRAEAFPLFGRRPLLPHLPLFHRPLPQPFFGLGPLDRPQRSTFGHGPAVINHPHRSFGPGPVHRPVRAEVTAREYTGVEDVFERDFEDTELDAREFDDELYLD